MLSTAECYIFDPTTGEEVTNPLSLGWILRNWSKIERVRVTPIFKTDGAYVQSFDAGVFFYLRDGRMFATPFTSSEVLLEWLDRPVFHSIPLLWFGYEGVCGGEKHRSEFFDYSWKDKL